MDKTQMVIATEYTLRAPKYDEKGRRIKGAFDENGTKVVKRKNIQLSREYVENCNASLNNKYYVIDEEASQDLAMKRAKVIELRSKDEQLKNVSPSEILGTIAQGFQSISAGSSEKEELQAELDEMGVKYDKRMGVKKLKELIELNK